jgi:hypothetical protein
MVRNVAFALLISLASSPALANDTTAALKTGGLEFVQTMAITMKEEKLFISPREVRVDYVYSNSTDKAVTSYIAFPMPDLTGDPAAIIGVTDPKLDNFLDFTVVQDGKAIKPSLQQRVLMGGIDMTDVVAAAKIPLNPFSDETRKALRKLPKETLADWIERGLIAEGPFPDTEEGVTEDYAPYWTLQSVYYWKTTFEPGKDIHVSHSYRTSLGGTVAMTFLEDGKAKGKQYEDYGHKYCPDDTFVKTAQKLAAQASDDKYYQERWISYILMTANNWAGPIGDFTLTVDKGDARNFVSFCGDNVKKTGATTFEMRAKDFVPERDLDILLLVPNGGDY